MASKLTKNDLSAALASVGRIAAAKNHDQFVASLIRALHPLLHSKVTAYNEADPTRKRFAFVVHPRHVISDAMIRAWVNHSGENPILQHVQRHPRDTAVYKITDFVPQKTFRRTVLCQKIYSRLGAEYQMALILPALGSASVAVVFNRAFDFTERDRQILTLLQPVLSALYSRMQQLIDQEVFTQPLLPSAPPARTQSPADLSRREKQVLLPLLRGESNKQIAARLDLSPRTIEKYVEVLLQKLHVPTRAAACAQYQYHSK